MKNLEDYKKAGEIAQKVTAYAKQLIKPGMPLVEIAQKIQIEIENQGAISAFPVNLSIDDIAAHYHPTINDETKATGLLKVDLGIHINGFVADTAFSIDLTPEKKYKQLIEASEQALKAALEKTKENPTLSQIGKTIQQTIEQKGFSPIINLSGHSMEKYDLHAGVTIPNINNKSEIELIPGLYAIEPFATSGNGKVYDGKPSGIYSLQTPKNIRNQTARDVLDYIIKEYQTIPFCSRWLVKKFTTKALFALRQLEQAEILHQYPQLIETSHKPVSQTENTILITNDKVEITSS